VQATGNSPLFLSLDHGLASPRLPAAAPLGNGDAPGRWRGFLTLYRLHETYTRHPFDGRCTTKGATLYVQAFSWPVEGLRLTGLKTPVRDARLLDGGARVKMRTETGSDGMPVVVLEHPARLDPVATVAALRLAGPPEVETVQPVTRADRQGILTLAAADAEIRGQTARLQGEGENANIGYWTDSNDAVAWNARVDQAGPYEAEIRFACPPDSVGSKYQVLVGEGADQKVIGSGTVDSTGSWETFKTEKLGRTELSVGKQTITVRALSKPGLAVMNLSEVRLTPVR